jgi:hypothetical protein
MVAGKDMVTVVVTVPTGGNSNLRRAMVTVRCLSLRSELGGLQV